VYEVVAPDSGAVSVTHDVNNGKIRLGELDARGESK
jgi:hypothetical protein